MRSLFFNPCHLYNAFLVTMFVFIIKMSVCPHEASQAVKAMNNISGCDDNDDAVFFSQDLQSVC